MSWGCKGYRSSGEILLERIKISLLGQESARWLSSPAHANLSTIGPLEAHAASSASRSILRPPFHWATPIPPSTIPAADSLACVVVSNGADLMITAPFRFAVPSAKSFSALNPTCVRAAVLGSLCRGWHRQQKGSTAQQQWHHFAHRGSENHSLITSWLAVSPRSTGSCLFTGSQPDQPGFRSFRAALTGAALAVVR